MSESSPTTQTQPLPDGDLAFAVLHNDLLPESVQKKARELLHEADAILQAIDDKIAHIQTPNGKENPSSHALLDSLHLLRRDKAAKIYLYRSAIAPIRKLPIEILPNIFLHFFGDTPLHIPYQSYTEEWNLRLVCRKWHQVFWGTPELWSNLEFTFTNYDDSDGDHPYLATNSVIQALEKSGQSPLKLVLKGEPITREQLESFVPHLNRTTHLTVDYPPDTFDFYLSSPQFVESLRSLDIAWMPDKCNFVSLQTAQHLRAVSLHAISSSSLSVILQLPLSQLTHLHLYKTPLLACHILNILACSSSVIECTFCLGTEDPGGALAPQALAHFDLSEPLAHNLHSMGLYIEEGCENEVTSLQSLWLPQLRHFKFYPDMDMWEVGLTPIILRSGLLETLLLRAAPISCDDLKELLLGAPHLVELSLEKAYASRCKTIASSIVQDMGSGALVPKLERLTCTINIDVDGIAALDQHLDMLEQRRNLGSAVRDIEHVRFAVVLEGIYSGGFKPERLTKMQQEGWDIEYDTTYSSYVTIIPAPS